MSIDSVTIPQILGTNSISTSMLQDEAVTTSKLNDGAVTSDKLGSGTSELKEIGQFTIANSTTSYDTASNFKDVSIALNELTVNDEIYIELFGQNQDNAQDIGLRVDIRDVTQTSTGLEVTYNEQVTFKNHITLRQHPSTTDLIRGQLHFFKSDTAFGGGNTNDYDTNDANVFATAFTVRLNGKYVSSASSSTIIYYRVWINRAPV